MQRLVMSLVLVAVLAGCNGPTPSNDPGASASRATVEEGGESALVAVTTRLTESFHSSTWANGTVPVQGTCLAGACGLISSDGVHLIAIEAPTGVPVRVAARLSFQALPVETSGSFDAWVETDGTIFEQDVSHKPGEVLVDALLVSGGTVELVLGANNPADLPDSAYALNVMVDSDSHLLLPGVPVAIDLSPGDHVEAAAGQPANYTIYGPDDALVATSKGSFDLPAAARLGQYVILLSPDSKPTTLLSLAPHTMTALGLRSEDGTGGTLPPHGAYDADFEVTGQPIGVGLRAAPKPGAAGTITFTSAGLAIRLTGPNGFELRSGTICTGCVSNGGFLADYRSVPGDPLVVPGTYKVHAETNATYEAYVVPYGLYVDRGTA